MDRTFLIKSCFQSTNKTRENSPFSAQFYTHFFITYNLNNPRFLPIEQISTLQNARLK